jgi:hypothetical protein
VERGHRSKCDPRSRVQYYELVVLPLNFASSPCEETTTCTAGRGIIGFGVLCITAQPLGTACVQCFKSSTV